MKVKKLIITLLLFICCAFAFAGCSKGTNFNFDKNGKVKLTYTCVDEENNFETELNAEQSNKFILSLNKILYDEINDQNVNFAVSYDSLIIKINDESLVLDDVAYIISHGGYFRFNGKLCKSEEKFGFLEPYFVAYCPAIIPNSVPFGVQYVKSGMGAEENCQIIKSVGELNKYIATETRNINLYDTVLFKDEVVDKYKDEYFKNYFIIIFMKSVGSGSFGFRVNNVYTSGERLIIDYEIVQPSDPDAAVTCDMAYWYSFVELSNEYRSIKNVDLFSLK